MKIKLLAALTILASLVVVGSSLGGEPLLFAQPLGTGQMQATVINAKAGAMVFERYTLKPGGSFPWHTHGAPAAAVVTRGTLTVLDPTINHCAPFDVHSGQAFVEPANHVHTARNEGQGPATVYVAYLGIPKGAVAVAPASAPAGCNG